MVLLEFLSTFMNLTECKTKIIGCKTGPILMCSVLWLAGWENKRSLLFVMIIQMSIIMYKHNIRIVTKYDYSGIV